MILFSIGVVFFPIDACFIWHIEDQQSLSSFEVVLEPWWPQLWGGSFLLIALQTSADEVVGGKDPWSHHFKGPALQMEWIPVFPLFQKNPQQIYFRHHFIMTKHFLSYKNRPIWACLNIFRLNRVRVAILFGNDFLCNYLPFSKGLMNFGCLEPSQKMLDFWIFLLVKRRLTEFIRVPPYEFLVFLRNFIFLPKQANFLGLTPNQPF